MLDWTKQTVTRNEPRYAKNNLLFFMKKVVALNYRCNNASSLIVFISFNFGLSSLTSDQVIVIYLFFGKF